VDEHLIDRLAPQAVRSANLAHSERFNPDVERFEQIIDP
jgi:hypothetical protein